MINSDIILAQGYIGIYVRNDDAVQEELTRCYFQLTDRELLRILNNPQKWVFAHLALQYKYNKELFNIDKGGAVCGDTGKIQFS